VSLGLTTSEPGAWKQHDGVNEPIDHCLGSSCIQLGQSLTSSLPVLSSCSCCHFVPDDRVQFHRRVCRACVSLLQYPSAFRSSSFGLTSSHSYVGGVRGLSDGVSWKSVERTPCYAIRVRSGKRNASVWCPPSVCLSVCPVLPFPFSSFSFFLSRLRCRVRPNAACIRKPDSPASTIRCTQPAYIAFLPYEDRHGHAVTLGQLNDDGEPSAASLAVETRSRSWQ